MSSWPTERFSVILVDPPWPYGNWTEKKNGACRAHYSTMSVEDICALPVHSISTPSSVLCLWATGPMIEHVTRVMEAWEFRYVTMLFVWIKRTKDGSRYQSGPGWHTKGCTEFLLLGKREKAPTVKDRAVHQVIETAGRLGHSHKPEGQYARIERLYDGPYVELFARTPTRRPGWIYWGDQVGSGAGAAPGEERRRRSVRGRR